MQGTTSSRFKRHIPFIEIVQKLLGNTVEYSLILGVHHIYIRGCPWDLNISPSIWQSSTSMQFSIASKAIKYCQAIIDDLLLFTLSPKSSHMAKLEDLFKALLKEWIEKIPKEMSII